MKSTGFKTLALIACGIIIIVLSGFLGYYMNAAEKSKKKLDNPGLVQTTPNDQEGATTTVQIPVPTDIDNKTEEPAAPAEPEYNLTTARWVSYEDTEEGYRFLYPEEFTTIMDFYGAAAIAANDGTDSRFPKVSFVEQSEEFEHCEPIPGTVLSGQRYPIFVKGQKYCLIKMGDAAMMHQYVEYTYVKKIAPNLYAYIQSGVLYARCSPDTTTVRCLEVSEPKVMKVFEEIISQLEPLG